MSTARRYLGREIYRSCAVVLIALLGLFTFFALVDELDGLGKTFTVWSLLTLEALALPTRLYDLLPIGLLIGAILALAGLAQRNELVILRVSGVSGLKLLGMLWLVTVPIMAGALFLSEYLTPIAEMRSSDINLALRGRAGSSGGRFVSGYWFREPTTQGGTRTINIQQLQGNGRMHGLMIYEINHERALTSVVSAPDAVMQSDGQLNLSDVTETRVNPSIPQALASAQPPTEQPAEVIHHDHLLIKTTLSPDRLLARVLVPERMSMLTLIDYIRYLERSRLQADRQVVALWRKAIYPFTLLVMITIAAPISFMQTRRGGIGAKVFIGILLGVAFFMVNQLALNVGMLNRWPPWLTALGPNLAAMLLAIAALSAMENRHRVAEFMDRHWPGRRPYA